MLLQNNFIKFEVTMAAETKDINTGVGVNTEHGHHQGLQQSWLYMSDDHNFSIIWSSNLCYPGFHVLFLFVS